MCIGPYGWTIAGRKPGDQVIIKPGHGRPKVEEATIDIIVEVYDFSALTAKGRTLNCWDSIEPTGKNFENFEVSDKAKEILAKLKKKKTAL